MTFEEFKIQCALGSLDNDTIYEIIESKSTCKEILIFLSKHEYFAVRAYVSYNPNTPIEILKELSKDKDYDVRCSATTAIEGRRIKENK